MTALPEAMGRREFARLLDCRAGYITQLGRDDRLVLCAAGRRVDVPATLARIVETHDASRRSAVADRAKLLLDAQTAEDTATAQSVEIADEEPAGGDPSFQYWRARREQARALAAERDNAVAAGRLLELADVTRTLAGAVTTLRSRLETLPDLLAPQVAALTDAGACRTLIADEVTHALDECARALRVERSADSGQESRQ